MTRNILAVGLMVFVIGCSSPPERNPIPPELTDAPSLMNDPAIRLWGDISSPPQTQEQVHEQYKALLDAGLIVDDQGNWKDIDLLTISGGGADGAYGAGLLNGMTAAGKRPEYRLVTGISTGAILGVYAFLGPEYDDKMRQIYTQVSDQDMYENIGLLSLLGSSSFMDTSGFEQMVRDEIDADLLARVREEHQKGRVFLVKTTNLDAQRPVIWNMGAIAMHDGPEAEALFESVILASASIPGGFPPVLLPVVVDGVQYDEMHVDAGLTAQVFFIPEGLDIKQMMEWEEQFFRELGLTKPDSVQSRIWLIRNSRLAADWQPSSTSIGGIMGRSVSTMIKYQGRSNVAQIYRQSVKIQSEFNLSYLSHLIPGAGSDAPFNKEYRRTLYCYGYLRGQDFEHWEETPPDYEQIQRTVDVRDGDTSIHEFNWDRLKPGLQASIEQCLRRLPE